MSARHAQVYGEAAARALYVAGAVDVTQPKAGFYRFRFGANTVTGAVYLWFGPPHDPDTGEELDRSWRWQAHFNGEPVDFERVWPACAGAPITAAEYRACVSRLTWARDHAPDSAFAARGRKIDPLSRATPLPF